jgi:hypothetical protein
MQGSKWLWDVWHVLTVFCVLSVAALAIVTNLTGVLSLRVISACTFEKVTRFAGTIHFGGASSG